MVTPDTPKLPVIREEERLLAGIRTRLLENPEPPGASEDDIIQQLLALREELRNAKTEDRPSLYQQVDQLNAVLDQIRSGRKTGEVDPDSPYFAHLRVEEEGRVRDVFLGRATRLGRGLRIVDWRNAPISRIFYRYQEGEDYSEEIAGRMREGRITARRTLHIQQGELLRVGSRSQSWVKNNGDWVALSDEQSRLAGGQGSALRSGRGDSRLGSGQKLRASKHLPDIAALIDPDQFELITAEQSGVVVLRGSAGSGKTTVALHRIAYLTFDKPRRFAPKRILVIVWGRAMRDYVSHVLPALGVEGVNVTTWTAWARTAVKRHYPVLPAAIAEDTPEPVTRIKLHPAFSQLLADTIAKTPGKPTMEQAIEDWSNALTDIGAIAEVLGEDIGEGALERAMRWTSDQVRAVTAWVEGDSDVDAQLDVEDDALLLRAWQLRVGPLHAGKSGPLSYAHIVLDEVQDFSPVEVQVLLETADKHRSVTLAGDTRQHISKAAGFTDWISFLDRIGVESQALSTLEVSYRSTHPITRFALEVLGDADEPPPRTIRSGPPVEMFRFSDHGAAVAFLAEALKAVTLSEPLANIALLTPTPDLSAVYAAGLEDAEVPDVRQVIDQQFAFAPGVDVVEADQVKGLEFDYVIIVEASAMHWPDTDHHRRLMHVAATRAVHQLWLTSVGTPSSILPQGIR
jgi:DNA helicase-2/ATP-dependent DNA helicase PcrA